MAVRTLVLLLMAGAFLSVANGQEDGRDQLLHFSLQVEVDDEARVQFAASETELARGDVLTAVSRWRALLDLSPPAGLIPVEGAFVAPPSAVRHLLRKQPPEVQRAYLEMTEPIAARALAAALLKDDTRELWRIVDRFPLTAAAAEACEQIAGRCFDAGRPDECRLAVERWLDDAKDAREAVARRPEMAVWRRLSLLSTGERALADLKWTEFLAEIPDPQKQLVLRLEGELSSTEAASEITDVTQVLPSDEAIWSAPVSDDVPETLWTTIVHDFETLAHPLLMVGRPVVTPRGFLVTGGSLRLLDVAEGKPRWIRRGPTVAAASNPQQAVASLRQALGESIAASVAVMGERLLTVQPLKNGRPRVAYADQIDLNSIEDGTLIRSMQEFAVASSSDPQDAKVLGAPATGHGQMFVPLQREETLIVAAFDPVTMQPRWQTQLGHAGLGLTADHRRLWMPAVVNARGEAVLCATGNGAVAALDPRTGRVQWIHRSQREDWRGAGPPPQAPTTRTMPRFRLWTGWRAPVLAAIGDVVLWAGPESDAITGLDRRSGLVRWKERRGDGLAVVTSGETLLVIGHEEIRRLNPADGTVRWSTPIAAPAGLGTVAGAWYVQPLRGGGQIALRLEDGAPTRSVSWESEVAGGPRHPLDELRSLTWTPQGILIQTPRTVSLHRTVAAVRESAPGQAAGPQWLAAAGQAAEAGKLAAETPDSGAGWRHRLKLIAQESASDQFHRVDRPAERRPATPRDTSVEVRIDGFLADRRPETALELLETTSLRGLSEVWVESNREPRVRLRADVLAAATILPARANAPRTAASLAPALRGRLDELLKRVAASRPDDVADLLELLKRSDWGASRLVERFQDSSATATDSRAHARRRLTLRSLRAMGGDVAPRAAQIEDGLRPAAQEIVAWPASEPRLSSVRPWKSLLDQWPVQFDHRDGSELECLSIDVKLTGYRIRNTGPGVHFTGCGQDSPWEIDLPKNDRSLGQSADYRQAAAVGPLILLQTGTGLHGLLPFDSAGQRGATHAWDVSSIDMWGSVTTHAVHFLPRLSDIAPGRHPLDVDDFGRPLTQVGPITAATFCYREFGRLVCCETATGRRLWDRTGYDADAVAVGDENVVIVVSPGKDRVETLDPLDGALIGSRPLGVPSAWWRRAIDTTAILRRGEAVRSVIPVKQVDEPSELSAMDLKTGERLWTQPIERNGVDFAVGQRLVGAVEAKSIRLFDPADGKERGRVPIESLPELPDVYAVDDPFALMICVFGPPAVEQLQPPLMLVGSRRRPYANGTVYGLDPDTLELKWTIALDRSVFPLDQPRDIPLLAIHDAVIEEINGQVPGRADRIRVFDKRTGRQVGPELRGEPVGGSGFVIERSQPQGFVELRTSRAIFHFDFPRGQ